MWRAACCRRGANGGDKERVARPRWSSVASPNPLRTQRPALAGAGRAGLRIESSTTELRWPKAPKLAARAGTRYYVALDLRPIRRRRRMLLAAGEHCAW